MASALLVRAKFWAEKWIIQYEHGGIAPMAVVMVLQRDNEGQFFECDAVAIRIKARSKEIAKALFTPEQR